MKIKLNVTERFTMQALLPKEENYLTFKLITELRLELSFSEKEIKQCNMKPLPNGEIAYERNNLEKDIEISDTILGMVREKLKSLETEKKINENNISLYELLVLNNRERSVKK